jgi:general secretion pathway protein C|nr:type II secretion system protein GspC [Kofleriaceae bacterium]
MQDLIKRYFWVLGAVVVMVCATFAAVAASFAFEATVLSDPDHGPKIVPVAGGPVSVISKAGHTKDGGQLASRDMFCSECLPKVDAAPKPGDSNQIVNTSLPLQLLATNVNSNPNDSFATIINMENQIQGSFSVGDKVPGATGAVKEIHYKYIDFENQNRTERLVLQGAPPPEMPKVAEAAPPAAGSDGEDLSLIKKIDDNNYEIDKSLVAKVLENPMSVAKGARVVPAIKNGKPDGFKLYAIKPDSVFAKMGLTNGDTLESINGMELTSADKALEVYTKVRDSTNLQVEITRRGKPMTISYTIK